MGYRDAPPGWWIDLLSALPARTATLATARADGSPHAAPLCIDVDDAGGEHPDVVVMTSAETVKGKAILRDGRVVVCIDDDRPPFAFVTLRGRARTSTDPDELLAWATRIGGRYMGPERAEEYGRCNAVPPDAGARGCRDRRGEGRHRRDMTCRRPVRTDGVVGD